MLYHYGRQTNPDRRILKVLQNKRKQGETFVRLSRANVLVRVCYGWKGRRLRIGFIVSGHNRKRVSTQKHISHTLNAGKTC